MNGESILWAINMSCWKFEKIFYSLVVREYKISNAKNVSIKFKQKC